MSVTLSLRLLPEDFKPLLLKVFRVQTCFWLMKHRSHAITSTAGEFWQEITCPLNMFCNSKIIIKSGGSRAPNRWRKDRLGQDVDKRDNCSTQELHSPQEKLV